MNDRLSALSPALRRFIERSRVCAQNSDNAVDCVTAIAPLMLELLEGGCDFFEPGHLRSDPAHYARNAIYIDDDGRLSLFALVWLPGQWTPVHDHGTWGVVGVAEGVLEERNYMADGRIARDEGIVLHCGGSIILTEKAVTTFVPNPDHIHKTGVPENRRKAVTLHLYGREMSNFHVYDPEAGTRRLIDVAHYKS
ncbi:MAG: cysteine dioxygenase family protein [Rhodospirillales bacterium]